jgi:hydrogenase expression/formation protein HypC
MDMGAWEANPLMRQALSMGHEFFFFSKYFLTASGLLFLLTNAEKRIFKGIFSLEEIITAVVLFYEGLVIYEVTLYYLYK